MKKIFLLVLVIAICGCSNDDDQNDNIDRSNFIPGRSFDIKQFSANDNIDYWDSVSECSINLDGGYEITIDASFGTKCNENTCLTKYDSANITHPINDFLGPCESCCLNFIRFEENKDVKAIALFSNIGEEHISKFLGDIDNFDEAIWLIRRKSYSITDPEFKGFMKKTENGFQFIAIKYVSSCNPETIEEHLLEVNINGDISVLQTKILSEKDICRLN